MKPLDQILQRWRMQKTVPHIPEGSKILDIGTADGQLFKLIKHRIKSGLGIDPNLSEPVACVRYRLIPGLFPEGIPKSEKFNVITMLAVIEHFPEDLLLQCDRICSDLLLPSGYVIITVPSKYCDAILKALKFLRLIDGLSLNEHHGFEVSMIGEIFPKKSFQLIYKKRFQLGFNNLFVFQKNR